MSKVVFVHGAGKQYLSEDSLGRDVVPELLGGVRLAGGPVPTPDEIGVAFYGDLFRPQGARAGVEPPYDEGDIETDEEFALLMGVVGGSSAHRPHRPGTGPDRYPGPGGLGRLARPAAEHRAGRARRPHRRAARARLAARISRDTRVIVGHSLGSVVAYETLCDPTLNGDWDIRMLVALGSPLGMRALVLDRLDPAAENGRAVWPKPLGGGTNIADAMDIVAVVRELRPSFGDLVTDVTAHNGSHVHDATRYLTAVETGRAIGAGLLPEAEAR